MRKVALTLGLVLAAGFAALAADSQDFSRWDKEITAFEQADKTNPPPKNGILFIGSSTIRLWKSLPEDFPNQPIINRGFGGSQIIDSTHFADRIIFPYAPRAVFLRAGGNDLWANKTVDQVFDDFKEFVRTVRAGLPKAELVFISWSPSIVRWSQMEKEKALNDRVRDFVAKNPGLKYIDTWSVPLDDKGQPRPELFLPDKLHFNAAGYALLKQRIEPYLPKK